MLAKWSIQYKLSISFAVLLAIVLLLSWGGMQGLYAYRDFVRTLSRRAAELPAVSQLSHSVADLRVCLADNRTLRLYRLDGGMAAESSRRFARDEFADNLRRVELTLDRYRSLLTSNIDNDRIGDNHRELQVVQSIDKSLKRVHDALLSQDWIVDDIKISRLEADLEQLQKNTSELPNFLHSSIAQFSEEVRGQYRGLISLSWITTASAAVMLTVFIKLFYDWIFRPLQALIKGSQRVAEGDFNYRIQLNTDDEMAGLANAMNDMTERFQSIRDDLDRQVQEQTTQLLRSEHMASVGFLAAGVSHEINNPLQAIAMGAESLEERLLEIVPADHADRAVLRKYLTMIQEEAFRCKEITSKLLDFSRIGEVQRNDTELVDLVHDVIDLIETLGSYDDKTVVFPRPKPVHGLVNPHEIKQVALNLIVNSLDAVDKGGRVEVSLAEVDGMAQIVVTDNGCGMTDEVQKHLFEPFFTRRRGGQGTGLGLSIAYRIVSDHAGTIHAYSEGPGKGSRFVVRLPLAHPLEVQHRTVQAA